MRSSSGDAPQTYAVRYDVTGLSSPGLLSMVLASFARRSLVPDLVWARRDGETTVVEIVLNEMPAELRAGCEANLRQLVDVVQVGVRLVSRRGRYAAETLCDPAQGILFDGDPNRLTVSQLGP